MASGSSQYAFVDFATREGYERCRAPGTLRLGGLTQSVEDRRTPSFNNKDKEKGLSSGSRGAGERETRDRASGGRGGAASTAAYSGSGHVDRRSGPEGVGARAGPRAGPGSIGDRDTCVLRMERRCPQHLTFEPAYGVSLLDCS